MRLQRWLQVFRTWKYTPDSVAHLITADAIIGLSFGQRKNELSPSNQAIANIVADIHRTYDKPLLLGWEVADLLPQWPAVKVFRKHNRPAQRLSARECLYQAAEVCQSNSWKHVILVTHPALMPRAGWICSPLGLVPVFADVSSVPYDPLSTHGWTRNARSWYLREVLGRAHHLILGWI